jgi:probable HAF family extracellular repeat protein
MKKSLVACIAAIFLGGVFSLPSRSSGQQVQEHTNQPVRYRLVDLGALGGPNSYQPFGYVGDFLTEASLSDGGTFAGWADTSTPDPFAPNCFFDCFVDHAFRWKEGVRTDLGALPGPPGLSSAVTWISSNGLISGFSQNGEIDPFVAFPVLHGVVWLNGKITDLKTLKGGYESWANSVNRQGHAVGFASNGIFDANSLQGLVTQTRAFVWQNGVMKDLGTLGGTDAEALYINDQGQIVGQSYTVNSIPPPNAHCTDSPLTLHAFFWEKGKMVDLGTLGGSCAFAYSLNNRGQVVGQATLDGDQEDHPFIWEQGKMEDLGALGGTYGYAAWLNDSGEVVGAASNEGDQAFLAFHWKNGKMTNLGALPDNACSVSDAINSSGQVVGGSGFSLSAFFPACTDSVEHAFLSENGRMIDLNRFVPDSSDLTLNEAVFINDRGEISGTGTLPGGDQHAFLLIPCGQDDDGSCLEAGEELSATGKKSAPIVSPATAAVQPNLTRRGMAARFHARPALTTTAEPAPTNLTPFAFRRGVDDVVRLTWTDHSTDSDSYYVESCTGTICTNFSQIAKLGANATTDTQYYEFKFGLTFRYRVRAHGPGGYSGYSNIVSQRLP